MHDRHNVISCRVTDPAGNSPKSNTSFATFGTLTLAAGCLGAFGFDFNGAAFLLVAAPFFGFDAGAAFAFFAEGLAFFAAVFDLLLVAAIVADSEFTWMDRMCRIGIKDFKFEISNLQS
jgi:hypothetical protein